MKPATTALINYLNTARASPDAQLLMADAFLFTLQNGSTLAYTNIDVTYGQGRRASLASSMAPGRSCRGRGAGGWGRLGVAIVSSSFPTLPMAPTHLARPMVLRQVRRPLRRQTNAFPLL